MDEQTLNFEKFGRMFKVDKKHFAEFVSLLQQKTIRKADYFLQFGEPCHHLGFVIKGTLRSFYINENGTDKSFNFYFDNRFFTNYESFLMDVPSKLYIQALEDSEVLLLHKKDLHKLFRKGSYWQEFGRIMAEMMYLEYQDRIEDLLYHSPEKRYIKLLRDAPDIFQKVSQKHIASFLGVTPQSLSRIRLRISKN